MHAKEVTPVPLGHPGTDTMGSILAFPSRDIRAEPRVLPYGEWLTDARLSSLGFSAEDIREIRRGRPIGAVLARRKVDEGLRWPVHPVRWSREPDRA